MLKNMLVELIGAYLITFIMAFSRITNTNDYLIIGITYFLVVASLTYAFKNVSGGHFNPILTISLIFSRQTSIKKATLYVVVQLLGSILAGFTVYALYNVPEDVNDFSYGEPRLKEDQRTLGAFLEFLVAFLLVYVYNAIMCNISAPKHIYGAAIGSVYIVGLLTLSNYTGGCINVVTLIGPAIFSGYYEDFGYYVIGQAMGGILAATFYSLFLSKNIAEHEEDEELEDESLVDKPKAI